MLFDTHTPEISITGQNMVNNALTAYVGRGFVLEDEVTIEADDSHLEYQSSPANFASNPELFKDTNWSGLTISDTGDREDHRSSY